MDKLEKFYTYISEKPKQELEIIEQDCKEILAYKVLALMKSTGYNGTIDIGNVMQTIYDEFLQKKMLIVCLMFSDGNKIYIEKTKLCNMLYFKNMFDDCNTNNEVFMEISLPDILDDYEMMRIVILFITSSICFIRNDADKMYKLAVIDDYVGEIIRGGKCHSPNNCGLSTLRTHLQNNINNIWKFRYFPADDQNRYNIAYDLCVMLNQDMNYVIIGDAIIVNESGFIGSKLHMNLCENERKRVDEKILLLEKPNQIKTTT